MINSFAPYEAAFDAWVADGFPGAKDETIRFLDWLSDPEHPEALRPGTLWHHQWVAVLRTIYAYEIVGMREIGPKGALLSIATGGGKTAIMAALIAWLRIAHGVQRYVMIVPNLIVKDRLRDDFQDGKVFKDRDLLPDWSGLYPRDFALTVLGGDGDGASYFDLLSSSVVLGNVHQFYGSSYSGKKNVEALLEGEPFALFNDEAHNSSAEEYAAALRRLAPNTALRVDLTGTPDRADGTHPETAMIAEYGIADALADGMVKTPVVYQPSITQVQLTYTDARTGERRKFEEIDWDEVDRLGLSATQWVTDEEPMRQQMAIAKNRLDEQEKRARGRYVPILFVVAVCIEDAKRAKATLEEFLKLRTLLVTQESDEEERKKATDLSRQKRTKDPYRAVVSVLMLREGWDVPEVGTIMLLRKFSSPVYGQQVVGRGLRRVRTKGVGDEESQILGVVDHPKLGHKWLWDLFGIKPRQDVLVGDKFDEKEDLPPPKPKQELIRPEKVIAVPEVLPEFAGAGTFEKPEGLPVMAEPRADWSTLLTELVYDDQTTEITGVTISGVTSEALGGDKWKGVHMAPETSVGSVQKVEMSKAELQESVRGKLQEMAEELLVDAGYSIGFKGFIYSQLLGHIRERFTRGLSLGLAEREDLEYAWRMIGAVREKVGRAPGLVSGMVVHGAQ